MQHGRNKLHLLLHPFRQVRDFAQTPIAKAEAVQPLERLQLRGLARDAFRFGQKDQHIQHAHLRIEPTLFGEVSDPR